MKYLKVDVSKEMFSTLLIEVPDDFDPKDIRHYDVQKMADDELYDSLCWETENTISVGCVNVVPEEEAKMYGITKLSDYSL